MKLDHYQLKAGERLYTCEFVSIGPKGSILKLVQFTLMDEELRLSNLGFGDWDETTGDINDEVVTDNGDTGLILAIVAEAVYRFYEEVINADGEIIQAFLAPGNTSDNVAATLRKLFKGLRGQVYGDKGFINQKMFEELLTAGLKLVTTIRSNMKNKLMLLKEKLLLKKRGIIESVIDILKSVCNLEHTRHRSAVNMMVNTYTALCVYSTPDRKPNLYP